MQTTTTKAFHFRYCFSDFSTGFFSKYLRFRTFQYLFALVDSEKSIILMKMSKSLFSNFIIPSNFLLFSNFLHN